MLDASAILGLGNTYQRLLEKGMGGFDQTVAGYRSSMMGFQDQADNLSQGYNVLANTVLGGYSQNLQAGNQNYGKIVGSLEAEMGKVSGQAFSVTTGFDTMDNGILGEGTMGSGAAAAGKGPANPTLGSQQQAPAIGQANRPQLADSQVPIQQNKANVDVLAQQRSTAQAQIQQTQAQQLAAAQKLSQGALSGINAFVGQGTAKLQSQLLSEETAAFNDQIQGLERQLAEQGQTDQNTLAQQQKFYQDQLGAMLGASQLAVSNQAQQDAAALQAAVQAQSNADASYLKTVLANDAAAMQQAVSKQQAQDATALSAAVSKQATTDAGILKAQQLTDANALNAQKLKDASALQAETNLYNTAQGTISDLQKQLATGGITDPKTGKSWQSEYGAEATLYKNELAAYNKSQTDLSKYKSAYGQWKEYGTVATELNIPGTQYYHNVNLANQLEQQLLPGLAQWQGGYSYPAVNPAGTPAGVDFSKHFWNQYAGDPRYTYGLFAYI